MKLMNVGQNKTAALAVSAGVLLVLAVSLASRITGRTGVTDPRVRIESRTLAAAAGAADLRTVRYVTVERAMEGEVSRTVVRVRESTAVATAASLVLAVELAERRAPKDAGELVAALIARGLLPPGFSAGDRPGTLVTKSGATAVRYRREPVGVEVVSVELGGKGPAILVRTPEDERVSGSGIWLADNPSESGIPRPFAPGAELIAGGWRADTLPNLK